MCRFTLTDAVFVWLFFWAVIANISIGGLVNPSLATNLVVFSGLASFWFGSLIYRKTGNLNLISKKFENNHLQYLTKTFNWTTKVSFLVLIPLVLKFISLVLNDQDSITRQALFGNASQDSILFGSQQLALLYFVFVQSILKVSVITGFSLTYLTRNPKYIIYGNFLCLLDSLIFMGRGFILEILFQAIFFVLVNVELRRKIQAITKFAIVIGALIAIFMGSFVGYIRGDTEGISIDRFIHNQIINYHTAGIAILDDEISNPSSRLNQVTTYGLATLGGIERLIILGVRRFDKSIDSVSGENGEYLAEFRTLGVDSDGNDLNYNAFGTIFYTFLLDGSYIYLIIAMFTFGMWISYDRRKFLNGDFFYIMPLYLLVQAGFNSLFFSPIESTAFWVVIIALFFIRKSSLNIRARSMNTLTRNIHIRE